MPSNNHLLLLLHVFLALALLLFSTSTLSSISPDTSLAPPPETLSDDLQPLVASPYTSPPPDLFPTPVFHPSPAPIPEVASNITAANVVSNNEQKNSSSIGMRGRKKAAITIGVITAAFAAVVFGGSLYKKRKQNIVRPSQFGYTARSDFP